MVKKLIALTVRVDPDMHKALTLMAKDEARSIASLILAQMRAVLREKGYLT